MFPQCESGHQVNELEAVDTPRVDHEGGRDVGDRGHQPVLKIDAVVVVKTIDEDSSHSPFHEWDKSSERTREGTDKSLGLASQD